MRLSRISAVAVVAAALLAARTVTAAPLNLQFSNIPGASLVFVGNGVDSTFSFPPNGVGQSDFRIDSQTSGSSLVNLLGEITGSFDFTAASVTTIGPVETAPVTSVGLTQFIIHADQDFTASLAWQNIRTIGQGGFVNTMAGDMNLTNFSYSGSNADLTNLLNIGSATVSASFQFIPSRDLRSLASTTCSGPSNPCSTSFSGSLATPQTTTPVPEESTASAVLVGVLALFALSRKYSLA
jgi:hypothetical protein